MSCWIQSTRPAQKILSVRRFFVNSQPNGGQGRTKCSEAFLLHLRQRRRAVLPQHSRRLHQVQRLVCAIQRSFEQFIGLRGGTSGCATFRLKFKAFYLQITSDKSSTDACDDCKVRIVEFYHFKRRSEEVRSAQTVHIAVQMVRNYVAKHATVEVKEVNDKLVISPKPNPAAARSVFHNTISIKQEVMDIKMEPFDVQIKEDPDADLPFLNFIRSFGESISEELTNSSEGSVSRLPAFEASTYFDGDRFVLRSEVPPKQLKDAKKRQRKPENWATNIQKKLRNAGQRYRSAKGYIVEARTMGAPCTCRKECGTKVNEKNRLMNFSNYWRLEDVSIKRKFILDHIKLERPMRAMTKSRAFSRLILHFLDVINSDGSIEQIKVCKTMFLNTFDISNTVITTTVKLHSQYFDADKRNNAK